MNFIFEVNIQGQTFASRKIDILDIIHFHKFLICEIPINDKNIHIRKNKQNPMLQKQLI